MTGATIWKLARQEESSRTGLNQTNHTAEERS
jgi:hypothetical protein